MNNASHIFDQFAVIFQEGKRKDCLLSDDGIKEMCMHFREVYVLWDGAFSLAQKFAPTDEDCKNYQKFVNAALQGSMILQCSITPKMHSMLRHVKWQMKNLPGGLGDKMEDWVERQHQWGMRMRRRFRTVQDPLVHAFAREKAASRNMHSDVRAQVESTDVGNKRNFLEKKAKNPRNFPGNFGGKVVKLMPGAAKGPAPGTLGLGYPRGPAPGALGLGTGGPAPGDLGTNGIKNGNKAL